MQITLSVATIIAAVTSMCGTLIALIITTAVRHKVEKTLKSSDDLKRRNLQTKIDRQVLVDLARDARTDWEGELNNGIDRMQKRTGADDFNGPYHKAFDRLQSASDEIGTFDKRQLAELQNRK